MGARTVGYWDNLAETPEEGPFVVAGGPVGADVPRIEHARGPAGVGCPVCLSPQMHRYMEAEGIPRGHAGASRLNELFREGAFEWDDLLLKPREEAP